MTYPAKALVPFKVGLAVLIPFSAGQGGHACSRQAPFGAPPATIRHSQPPAATRAFPT